MSETPKVMLVTGGSRGIGAAIVEGAIERGYDLCINYTRSEAEAQALVDKASAAGRKAIAVQADVADSVQINALFNAVDQAFGRLDVLVNNAGVVAKATRFVDITEDRLKQMMDINLMGAIYCSKAAVARMSTTSGGQGGSIVNISSVAAQLGGPNEYIDYAMAKGAMDTMTTGLAKEVATEGIRVNAVRPGLIYTDIHASGGVPDRVDKLAHLVPMQRGGEAREVANAALWLASDEASYVTGSFLNVSGGR